MKRTSAFVIDCEVYAKMSSFILDTTSNRTPRALGAVVVLAANESSYVGEQTYHSQRSAGEFTNCEMEMKIPG